MTQAAAQNELDRRIRALCATGDHAGAATAILRALGPDVVRIIFMRFRQDDATAEVFSRFIEALWLALPAFAFRCSVRSWVFTLCRNVGNQYLKRELRSTRRTLPLSQVPELKARADTLRTATLAHLRSENSDRVRALRSNLDESDQLLLTLRIDRELEFREIALVMLGDVDADEARVARESARLRKRLQLIKDKLRRLLEEAP